MGSEREELRAKVLAEVVDAMSKAAREHSDWSHDFAEVATDAILSLLSPELGGWRGIESDESLGGADLYALRDAYDRLHRLNLLGAHRGFEYGLFVRPLPPPPTGAR